MKLSKQEKEIAESVERGDWRSVRGVIGNDGDMDIIGANWSGGYYPFKLLRLLRLTISIVLVFSSKRYEQKD